MNRQEFKGQLAQGPLLLDGAMGTVLHGRGIPIDECFDAISLRDPALVADIHRRYIAAGADIIETNSFGANRFKLAQHGLVEQVQTINEAAVAVARRAIESSFKEVYLAGSVGPLGVRLAPLGRVPAADAEDAFAEQIAALVAAPAEMPGSRGVDLIVLETIPDLEEMAAAVRATRRVAPDIPVIGMIAFTRDDRTLLGDTPAHVADFLAELDLDALGVNCSSGPVQVLRLIAALHERLPDIPLSASPNAGWPQQQEGGRVLYPATPAYFAGYARAFVDAGARLIGGCCGTTADHVAAMRQALDDPQSEPATIAPHPARSGRDRLAIATADQPTQLIQAFDRGQFVVTVEMSPPRGISAQRLLAGARMLKEAGAGFIDVADSPLARMRMSAWAVAHLVQKEIELEAVLHFPTRGRNLLRIQGDLLAAHALGIRNLFVVMGDPTQIGDYPEAMDNYDIVPSGLIKLIKERLNSGLDQAGQAIDQPTSFTVGCALNLEPADTERELRLLGKKIRNGADFALTQPVFDPAMALDFMSACHARYGPAMIPVVAGVQPLFSSGNAEFLHNEVPGITIPDDVRQRMYSAVEQQAEGVLIAQEILEALSSKIQGVYMIPVFGRYNLIADVLDVLPYA
jgi:homocysteine S-methyltransferase